MYTQEKCIVQPIDIYNMNDDYGLNLTSYSRFFFFSQNDDYGLNSGFGSYICSNNCEITIDKINLIYIANKLDIFHSLTK